MQARSERILTTHATGRARPAGRREMPAARDEWGTFETPVERARLAPRQPW
jgi:hypothetical protein